MLRDVKMGNDIILISPRGEAYLRGRNALSNRPEDKFLFLNHSPLFFLLYPKITIPSIIIKVWTSDE